MSDPLTTGRKFNPTFYGLHQNQQILAGSLLFIEMCIFMISHRLLGIGLTYRICLVTGIILLGFGVYVGRSQTRLYRFECTWRFILSMAIGETHIEKFSEGGLKKAKDFAYLKWIHRGGFIEYFYDPKKRPHNWGAIIWLDAFDPENLQAFMLEVQRMLMGLKDKTVLKTSVNIRNDLRDYAEPITIMLQQNDMPEIVRESMMEHEQLIKTAQIKNYENYMLVLIDYTASKNKAIKTLKITLNSISEVLRAMDIENHQLESAAEVREAFFGQVTYNVHQARKVNDDVLI